GARDGVRWWVSAYWHRTGESILLRSTDGRAWTRVSTIHRGDANDETEIEFLDDGRLLATARLEMAADNLLGHAPACTAIAVAEPPHQTWTQHRSRGSRLDRPLLLSQRRTHFHSPRPHPPPHHRRTPLVRPPPSNTRTPTFGSGPACVIPLANGASGARPPTAAPALRGAGLSGATHPSRIDRE